MHAPEERARTLAGLADTCELVATTFAYPADGRLAAALADGSYARDARGCLVDAGAAGETVEAALGGINALLGRDPDELADALRTGHSLLFLAPGADVPVWPYEAAFRFVAQGRQGTPSLFRSPIELDVERHMRAAGVLPEHARTEPPDSIWNEFAFMAFLLAQALNALRADDSRGVGDDARRAREFARDHMALWLPLFMEKIKTAAAEIATSPKGRTFDTECSAYTAFAQVGALAWDTLAQALRIMR